MQVKQQLTALFTLGSPMSGYIPSVIIASVFRQARRLSEHSETAPTSLGENPFTTTGIESSPIPSDGDGIPGVPLMDEESVRLARRWRRQTEAVAELYRVQAGSLPGVQVGRLRINEPSPGNTIDGSGLQ